MAELQLGVPIEIDGKDVIFVRDVIGTKALSAARENEIYSIIEPRGDDGRPPIYIDEKELEILRENFPGADVYGLWQILFANGKAPLGEQLTVFRTGPTTGQYLQMEAGSDYYNPANIIQSSEFIANYLTDLHDYDLEDAAKVEVDLSELFLPDTPAYTRAEMAERRRHEETKRWYAAGTACLVIAVAAAVYNYAMFTVYKMNMAEYGAKKVQVDELSQRVEALLRERLEVVPNDKATIDRIDQIVAYEPEISTSTVTGAANGFTAGHEFLTRPGYRLDLSTKVRGVSSELTPSMAYQLTLSSDQEVAN